MSDKRRKENLGEAVKNAFAGYAMVVLAAVCFVLSLVAVTAIVRLVVGASVGAGA